MSSKSYEILSCDTVQEMHDKFKASVEKQVQKALALATEEQDTKIEDKDHIAELVKTLVITSTRKSMELKTAELANIIKQGKNVIEERIKDVEELKHPGNKTSYKSANFSTLQKEQLAQAARKRKKNPNIVKIFGEEERIYLKMSDTAVTSKTGKKVVSYLEERKYTILDYNKGYATNAQGKQQFKIGKLLKGAPALAEEFREDSSRTSASLNIIISINTHDIASMSTGRGWGSCMGSDGGNYSYVLKDIKHGTLIAYLVSEKDPNILNPLSRILIKPCEIAKYEADKITLKEIANNSFNQNEPQIFSADKIYGLKNDCFTTVVNDFIDRQLNNRARGLYKLDRHLYVDGIDNLKFVGSGSYERGGTKKYYHENKLHREDGPALEWSDGGKRWYINGELHREDGPAIEQTDGTKHWYINGNLHREDGPAIERNDGGKYWYINGELHREDGPAVEQPDGTKCWYINGKLHREDGPAVERSDGTKHWYINGKLHREDGPAVEQSDGTKCWYINGKLHREDRPAIEKSDGSKEWYINGELHREDGPAVEDSNGNKEWHINGELHREDGPAVEDSNGNKEWHINGKRHREDGPAVEQANGNKYWYINDHKISKKEFNKWKQQHIQRPKSLTKKIIKKLSLGRF